MSMHIVSVRRVLVTEDKDGVTSRMILNTPNFTMGGVDGQAMTANDVVTTVRQMLNTPATATLFVNGKRVNDADSEDSVFIDLWPTDA